jgi:hypothetical protein
VAQQEEHLVRAAAEGLHQRLLTCWIFGVTLVCAEEACAKTHSKAHVRLSDGLNLSVAAGNDGLSTTAIDNSVLRL